MEFSSLSVFMRERTIAKDRDVIYVSVFSVRLIVVLFENNKVVHRSSTHFCFHQIFLNLCFYDVEACTSPFWRRYKDKETKTRKRINGKTCQGPFQSPFPKPRHFGIDSSTFVIGRYSNLPSRMSKLERRLQNPSRRTLRFRRFRNRHSQHFPQSHFSEALSYWTRSIRFRSFGETFIPIEVSQT